MKNILVPSDFSVHSRHSLEYAVKLMHNEIEPSRILILNTYCIPFEVGMTRDQIILLNDEMKRISKKLLSLEQMAMFNLIKGSNITIQTSSHIGTLKNVVHQLLEEEKFDLIVMGKDGGRHVETIVEFLKSYECPLTITYLNA